MRISSNELEIFNFKSICSFRYGLFTGMRNFSEATLFILVHCVFTSLDKSTRFNFPSYVENILPHRVFWVSYQLTFYYSRLNSRFLWTFSTCAFVKGNKVMNTYIYILSCFLQQVKFICSLFLFSYPFCNFKW